MATSQLIAHRGARIVTRQELDEASTRTPPATDTWVPISHNVVLDRVGQSLSAAGFHLRTVQMALSRGDSRLFATIDTATGLAGGDVTLAVAVVNSVDRSLPMKFIAGNRVFCCDNLTLRSDLMAAVVRKHTKNGLDRFNEALSRAVTSLDQFRQAESSRIKRYMHTELSTVEAEAVLLRAYERDIVSHRLLPRLIAEYRKPSFDYGCSPRSLWTLENAFTTVFSSVARSNPQRFCALSFSLQELMGEAAGVRPEEQVPALSA